MVTLKIFTILVAEAISEYQSATQVENDGEKNPVAKTGKCSFIFV